MFLFLTFCMLAIIVSIYIAKKNLIEISQEKEELRVSDISRQAFISPPPSSDTGKSKEARKAELKPEESEFNLNEVPDEYFNKDIKVIEDKAKEEGASPVESKLNKQPTLDKLKELKSKNVIIY